MENVVSNQTFQYRDRGSDLSRSSWKAYRENKLPWRISFVDLDPVLYRKLGLDPTVDYHNAAIGVLCQTPYETAIITADIALKAAAVQLGFVDRFSGTLVITGSISDVTIAWEHVLEYVRTNMGFTTCPITKA